jgi:hypothetical protein
MIEEITNLVANESVNSDTTLDSGSLITIQIEDARPKKRKASIAFEEEVIEEKKPKKAERNKEEVMLSEERNVKRG